MLPSTIPGTPALYGTQRRCSGSTRCGIKHCYLPQLRRAHSGPSGNATSTVGALLALVGGWPKHRANTHPGMNPSTPHMTSRKNLHLQAPVSPSVIKTRCTMALEEPEMSGHSGLCDLGRKCLSLGCLGPRGCWLRTCQPHPPAPPTPGPAFSGPVAHICLKTTSCLHAVAVPAGGWEQSHPPREGWGRSGPGMRSASSLPQLGAPPAQPPGRPRQLLMALITPTYTLPAWSQACLCPQTGPPRAGQRPCLDQSPPSAPAGSPAPSRRRCSADLSRNSQAPPPPGQPSPALFSPGGHSVRCLHHKAGGCLHPPFLNKNF